MSQAIFDIFHTIQQYAPTQAVVDQSINEAVEVINNLTFPVNPFVTQLDVIKDKLGLTGVFSMKDLARKVQEAKDQREVDEQLYGPNLPPDCQSKFLELFEKYIV